MKPNLAEKQLSLDLYFDLEVPTPAPIVAGSNDLALDIAREMSRAIATSNLPREVIGARMGEVLGKNVSVAMLNAYTATSKDAHVPPLDKAIAFDLVTGHQLLRLFAAKCGARVYIGRDALLAELGRVEVLRDELARQAKQIKHQMEGRS